MHASFRDKNAPGNGVYISLLELYFEKKGAGAETLHLRRQVRSARGGLKRSSIRSRGMEFFESRPYVAADEMRTIDWKVSARKNTLYTKIFIEEKDRPIFLGLDLRRHMFFGTRSMFKSVLAAKLAARLAFAGQNGGDRVGAFILNDHGVTECPKGSSDKSMALLLGKIAHATKTPLANEQAPAGEPHFWRAALMRMSNRIESGAWIFLISDFHGLSESDRPFLYKLRKRSDIFALSIRDPLEEKLPSLGMVGMLLGDQVIQFNSSNASLEHRYRTRFLEEQAQCSNLFKALDIPHIAFSTADDMDTKLRSIFSGRW
ncbi:MAG TPA: DUF58 domain-containing protein [Myxococcota bacterium]|nr:DUF58 domain-containing protein [Myxococcota bacterium]